MERFTEYRKPTDNYYLRGTNSAMVCFNGSNACEKLGKLEDLEEQLGMPLEVLFNVVGKDIYIVDSIDNTYMPFTINTFYLDNSIYYLSYVDGWGLDMSVESNDFNKTWFLTREDAERKLEDSKQ